MDPMAERRPAGVAPVEADSKSIEEALESAERLYERYLDLAGVARIPTNLEAAAYEREWELAEREPRPLGLVFDPSTPIF